MEPKIVLFVLMIMSFSVSQMEGSSKPKAVAHIIGFNHIRGTIHFTEIPDGITHVHGKISGLLPGEHGFHIHANGDTTKGCDNTGTHFNPFNKTHGDPRDGERHAGDLGNIVTGPNGVTEISIKVNQVKEGIPLSGPNSIIGASVVVHVGRDDLGKGGHEDSKSTGNAGPKDACGRIEVQP